MKEQGECHTCYKVSVNWLCVYLHPEEQSSNVDQVSKQANVPEQDEVVEVVAIRKVTTAIGLRGGPGLKTHQVSKELDIQPSVAPESPDQGLENNINEDCLDYDNDKKADPSNEECSEPEEAPLPRNTQSASQDKAKDKGSSKDEGPSLQEQVLVKRKEASTRSFQRKVSFLIDDEVKWALINQS